MVNKIGSRLEQRTARKWYNEGELSNKYFFNILNRKLNDDIDVILTDEGNEITDKDGIQEEIRKFYRDLYESVPETIVTNDEFRL